MSLVDLMARHHFETAVEALDAIGAPEEMERRYETLPWQRYQEVSERALAASQWLDHNPAEAAAARADRAQLAVLAWRELAGKAATAAEREICLNEASDAADDLSFQLQRLARATARAA